MSIHQDVPLYLKWLEQKNPSIGKVLSKKLGI